MDTLDKYLIQEFLTYFVLILATVLGLNELAVLHRWDDDEKLRAMTDTVRSPLFAAGNGIVYFTLIKTLDRFSGLLAAEVNTNTAPRVQTVCI